MQTLCAKPAPRLSIAQANTTHFNILFAKMVAKRGRVGLSAAISDRRKTAFKGESTAIALRTMASGSSARVHTAY